MTIPATHAEIEQIYLAAELAGCRSLCITACQSGDGVTSIASALTERYLLAGHNTLLVDLNMFNPAFRTLELSESDDQSQALWIEHKESHQLFTGVAIPNDRSTQLAYKDPALMAKAVTAWNQQYDRVIVDTSPLLQVNKGNIPAQSVASACEKTVLVVRGGVNTTSQLQAATELLNCGNIELLGSILNIKDQPSLSLEIIREIRRIPLPQKLRQKVESWFSRNEFLSQSA
ncbi:AAA family ATPase [Vibrio sp. SCSIO 43135]|uniref:AAA family ATPase n=1 Tax=Vibrio sp. SCSIO 43135 TaxID=2819096 RepID=UPI0020753613|nr:AAA family ATPase [Vibrio sp. SCSIO 43135]USD39946.1 AAA family ATPase [Vibrio sp. SCSIO 43135]